MQWLIECLLIAVNSRPSRQPKIEYHIRIELVDNDETDQLLPATGVGLQTCKKYAPRVHQDIYGTTGAE